MRLKPWGFLRGGIPLSEPAVRATRGFAKQKSMARSQPTRACDERSSGTRSLGEYERTGESRDSGENQTTGERGIGREREN